MCLTENQRDSFRVTFIPRFLLILRTIENTFILKKLNLFWSFVRIKLFWFSLTSHFLFLFDFVEKKDSIVISDRKYLLILVKLICSVSLFSFCLSLLLFLLRRICLLYFVLIISFLKFRFLFSFKFQLPTLVLACLLCDYKHILYENII